MRILSVILLTGAVLLAQENKEVKTEDMAKAMQEMQKAMQQLNEASAGVEVIGFRDLKAALPKELLGLPLHDSQGEKNAAMGMKMSKASGEYGTRGEGPHLELEIVDVGTLKGIVGMSMASWSMMEVDRESDTEMEQTFDYKSYRGHKEYNFEEKEGELSLIVSGRVIVNFKVKDLPLDQMTRLLDGISFDTLEQLIASVQKTEE